MWDRNSNPDSTLAPEYLFASSAEDRRLQFNGPS
jgi:hypothetical protein